MLLAATTAETPALPAPKRQTAKEMREEEVRVGMEQTRTNIDEAPPASSGGTTSDDHGSEDGVPLEVVADYDREAAREADRVLLEERARERKREQWEEGAVEKGKDRCFRPTFPCSTNPNPKTPTPTRQGHCVT